MALISGWLERFEAIMKATAYHEAAHAIAALRLGVGVSNVRLHPESVKKCLVPDRDMSVPINVGGVELKDIPSDCQRAVISRAGLLSELLTDRGELKLRNVRKDGSRWRKADRNCKRHSVVAHRDLARDLILREINSITKLAKALLISHSLTEEEVVDLTRV